MTVLLAIVFGFLLLAAARSIYFASLSNENRHEILSKVFQEQGLEGLASHHLVQEIVRVRGHLKPYLMTVFPDNGHIVYKLCVETSEGLVYFHNYKHARFAGSVETIIRTFNTETPIRTPFAGEFILAKVKVDKPDGSKNNSWQAPFVLVDFRPDC